MSCKVYYSALLILGLVSVFTFTACKRSAEDPEPVSTVPVEDTSAVLKDEKTTVPEETRDVLDSPADSSADSEMEAVSEAVSVESPAPEGWRTAYEKGCALVDAGDTQTASYYFTNALGKAPGNMEIITKYVESLQSYIDSVEEPDVKYSYLTAIESFVQNQILYVPSEQVETLIASLKSVSQQRDALESLDAVAADTPSDAVAETDDNEISEAFAGLRKALEEQNGYVLHSLDAGLYDIASYQMQECEQIMRGIIALSPKLPDGEQKEVVAIYANLTSLADSIVDKKAEDCWKKYLVTYDAFQAEFDEIRDSNGGKGVNQQKIEAIQKQTAKLQQVMPKLSPTF